MRVRAMFSAATTAAVLVAGLAGGIASAAPSQVYVSTKHCSDSGPGTQQTPFCTVQKGVDTVSAGGTVHIGPGTYPEQVTISGKNNITLRGSGNGTVIQMPAASTGGGAIVDVTDAQGLTMTNLKVNGPFTVNSCATPEYGIRLNNNVNGVVIQHVSVTNIEPASDAYFGCQQGIGIDVGRNSTGAVASATLTDVQVSNYAKDGILVDNTGSNAIIKQSSVTGRGPTPLTALNGIQISRGATATIQQTSVKGNEYTLQTYSASGMLFYQAGQVTVKQNSLSGNDVGMDVETHGSLFMQNTITDSVWNGIYNEPDSTGNTFQQNSAHNTSGAPEPYTSYDMEDDSTGSGTLHTANTWSQDSCTTSSPALLCQQ